MDIRVHPTLSGMMCKHSLPTWLMVSL